MFQIHTDRCNPGNYSLMEDLKIKIYKILLVPSWNNGLIKPLKPLNVLIGLLSIQCVET